MFFGNHGHGHCFLSQLTRDDQLREIRAANTFLEEILERRVDTISYPYGDYNADTLDLCRELSFEAGVTVLRGDNTSETPFLELRRMDVKEVSERAFPMERQGVSLA